jgi:hypothetical protein
MTQQELHRLRLVEKAQRLSDYEMSSGYLVDTSQADRSVLWLHLRCPTRSSISGTTASTTSIADNGRVDMKPTYLKPSAPARPPIKNMPSSDARSRSLDRSALTYGEVIGECRQDPRHVRGVLPDGQKAASVGRARDKRKPAPKAPVVLIGALRPRETSQVLYGHVCSL